VNKASPQAMSCLWRLTSIDRIEDPVRMTPANIQMGIQNNRKALERRMPGLYPEFTPRAIEMVLSRPLPGAWALTGSAYS
jgi:hypothetical protein